jgi:hypothetical protein
MLMKKISAVASPNGKEGIIPIPTFSCVACGYVNQMFRPVKSARTDEQATETRTESAEAEPTRPKLVLED